MICSRCQTENSPDSGFCDECGAPLETLCRHCNNANRPGAKFCKTCGQRLAEPPAPAGAASSQTGPVNAIVPRYLAEKILASRRFIEGERKQVTVLFADIRGSTSLIEKLDPEEVRRHFDPIIHIMMDAVHQYEGTVNQVLGDGIMALFGAPLAHEDHAVRACYAALKMQEGIRLYDEHRGANDDPVRIGVGINSGEVVVRSITNDLNIDYSALGHTTHLAARMEALASAGSILLTSDTLREVEGFVEIHPLGAVQVKGFSNSVEVFELIGATGIRNRFRRPRRADFPVSSAGRPRSTHSGVLPGKQVQAAGKFWLWPATLEWESRVWFASFWSTICRPSGRLWKPRRFLTAKRRLFSR